MANSAAVSSKRKTIDTEQAWVDCLRQKAIAFSETNETTETAALAALGACKSEEDSYFAKAYATPTFERFITGPRGLDPEFRAAQNQHRTEEIESVRQQLIAKIAGKRAHITE